MCCGEDGSILHSTVREGRARKGGRNVSRYDDDDDFVAFVRWAFFGVSVLTLCVGH